MFMKRCVRCVVPALALASAACGQEFQANYTASTSSPGWPWVPTFGPGILSGYLANPPSWQFLNWTTPFPSLQPLIRNASLNSTKMLAQGWQLTGRLAIDKSKAFAEHPSPYGNLGSAVVAVRVEGCLFDMWFSNDASGNLLIQFVDAANGTLYSVGPPLIVPGVGTNLFDLSATYNSVTKRVRVRVNGNEIPGAGLIRAIPASLSWSVLGNTAGLSLGISSQYGVGQMRLQNCRLITRNLPTMTPSFASLGPCDTAAFQFEVLSSPGAKFAWYHDGQLLPQFIQKQIEVKGSDPNAGGVYTCIVEDDFGVALASAYVAVCQLDLNCDRTVDLTDFFTFFTCFDTGQPCADLDGSGDVELPDFFLFFNLWDSQEC